LQLPNAYQTQFRAIVSNQQNYFEGVAKARHESLSLWLEKRR
jgi:hypothetical protein